MSTKDFSKHFKVINIWLGFVLFLIVSSNLSHQPAPIYSWINCALYFLLFLQCLFLFKNTTHNKPIFFNIGLFALVGSLSLGNIFIGEGFAWDDQYLAYYVYEYRTMLLSFLLALSVIYIGIRYLFTTFPPLHVYVITLAIILPVFFWHFHPFVFDKDYIFLVEESVFHKSDLYVNLLPLSFVVLYGVILYLYDRSLGEHINTLMVGFFLLNLAEVTNLFGYVYDVSIYVTAFSISQYVLLVILCFFLITMFRLMNYTDSKFALFYDPIVTLGNDYGVPIKRKKRLAVSSLSFAQAYFQQRRNAIGFLALAFIFCINYFNVASFLKLNLAVLSLGMIVLFYFLTALSQKRINNGDILSAKRN